MAESHPKITVLIPTFNRAHFLEECLDSILAQTLSATQILVVNDSSTDHTRDVLRPYLEKIDYLETPQVGKPSAINRGLERTVGDYVWIFDDDDVAVPDALERLVEPLEKTPEYGFSYGTFYFTASGRRNHRLGSVKYAYQIPDLEKTGLILALLRTNVLGGAALFARTSCYREVGNFDPELLRSQDYDMAIRIARRFRGVRVAGGPTFHYRQHSDMRGSMKDRFVSGMRLVKWLEYDQMFFRKFYRELSLGEYLPPNSPLDRFKRQALLQRLTFMARKFLIPEAAKDLNHLAELGDESSFSEEERRIVRSMVENPYYRVGNILDKREYVHTLRRLSASSKAVALLRKEIASAILKWSVEQGRLWRIPQSIRRLFNLYL